jgi:hypothetical protein
MTRDGNKRYHIIVIYLNVEVPTPNKLDRSGEKE